MDKKMSVAERSRISLNFKDSYILSFLIYLLILYTFFNTSNLSVTSTLMIVTLYIIPIILSKIILKFFSEHIDTKGLEKVSGSVFTAVIASISIFIGILSSNVLIIDDIGTMNILVYLVISVLVNSMFLLLTKSETKLVFLISSVFAMIVTSALIILNKMVTVGAELTLVVNYYGNGVLVGTSSSTSINWLLITVMTVGIILICKVVRKWHK
ncbi:MAG: hypothetical protein V1678_03970, partial [Candidatus Aenigmatarchaeota archaeon]